MLLLGDLIFFIYKKYFTIWLKNYQKNIDHFRKWIYFAELYFRSCLYAAL